MPEMTGNDKIITLFNYINELSNIKTKLIRNVSGQFWYKRLSELPTNEEYIIQNNRDVLEGVEYDGILLEVRKPMLLACPQPDQIFVEWLNIGWDNPNLDVGVKESIQVVPEQDGQPVDQESEPRVVLFDSDSARPVAYENWKLRRDKWASVQRERLKIRDLFTALYKLHVTLERDTDTRELLVGNGLLTDKQDASLSHPIITKRVKTEFDALSNVIRVVDTDVAPELYTSLLTSIEDFSFGVLPKFTEQLAVNAYHPLDNVEMPEFMKQLLHSLSPDSQYIDDPAVQRSERFQIRSAPMLFVRARRDGVPKAIEAIINAIKESGEVPSHLLNLVGEGKITIEEDSTEKTLPEQLAEVGGEDVDILLTKAANKEQLEIARRISKYDAVLVQGPPGTGKTHTIANLIGHFLAQGNTVLVTSHTKKALSVVKGQVSADLQTLCVAVLDDNNSDMEKSVDGITEMISRYSVHDLNDRIQAADIARKAIIAKLAAVRQRIYEIKNSEFSPIIIGGESISPADAAKFVNQHPEYDVVPGKIELRRVLPLSYEELQSLYNSNSIVTSDEENELECELPNPEKYPSPDKFGELVHTAENACVSIQEACSKYQCHFQKSSSGIPEIVGESRISIASPSRNALKDLHGILSHFSRLEDWMIYAAVDGKAGGGHAQNWYTLISVLTETATFSESLVEELFGKEITFADSADMGALQKVIPEMSAATMGKAKLGKLDYMFHSEYKTANTTVKINGNDICCHNDYVLVEHQLKLMSLRADCERYWNQLLSVHGLPSFMQLACCNPELVAIRMIPQIEKYLKWFECELAPVKNAISGLGLDEKQIFMPNTLDTDIDKARRILSAVDSILPLVEVVIDNYLTMEEVSAYISDAFADVCAGSRESSILCRTLNSCVHTRDVEEYRKAYYNLRQVYDKYRVLEERKTLLEKMYAFAPDWSYAIRSRSGIHGQDIVPPHIDEAWRWKQYSGILDEMSKDSLVKLQSDSAALSRQYREKTAELSKWKAWYALKVRIDSDISLKSSLISWKQVTQKTGKARRMTGIYREEARKHMIKCQQAVPAWIMPMAKVFENFTPGQNSFDVVIVDEASQSDISALAVTYMGKKVIIVGDDKQVSPTGVGIDLQRMIQLAEGSIKDIIPSWELYTGNTSLYDIVSTVYPSLMLREHFRCVPDIIGYSNKLSYDYKIKPLRDTSACAVSPAVVNYRVNGFRDARKKQNDTEAKTIIALLRACLERKEYEGKTFGIISLLGDEQPRLIEKYLFEQIDAAEIEKRKIIYGTSAQFQGDERDVIFLSMVDSNATDGPLAMQGFGTDDMFRKRYNVAASRAKDQLWLIHSLDSSRDLKDGDIRKGLIEYAKSPQAFQQLAEQVGANAESPFEELVGKSLVAKGYSVVQQWPVGAYRIDMVVVDGDKRVAIECDGERWHSSELQVRGDMERQTILERLGWRFIRIRGSEYFRLPEQTMEHVFSEIEALDIHPHTDAMIEQTPDSDLLTELKRRAEELLTAENFDFAGGDASHTIDEALGAMVEIERITDDSSSGPEVKPLDAQISEKTESGEKAPTKGTESEPPTQAVAPQAKPVRKGSNAVHRTYGTHSLDDHRDGVQMTLPDMEVETTTSTDIIALIKKAGVKYVDKRSNNGALWIVGGKELVPLVNECKQIGVRFTFKAGGGRATNNKDAWWAK